MVVEVLVVKTVRGSCAGIGLKSGLKNGAGRVRMWRLTGDGGTRVAVPDATGDGENGVDSTGLVGRSCMVRVKPGTDGGAGSSLRKLRQWGHG